jgi:hypothetical protein
MLTSLYRILGSSRCEHNSIFERTNKINCVLSYRSTISFPVFLFCLLDIQTRIASNLLDIILIIHCSVTRCTEISRWLHIRIFLMNAFNNFIQNCSRTFHKNWDWYQSSYLQGVLHVSVYKNFETFLLLVTDIAASEYF